MMKRLTVQIRKGSRCRTLTLPLRDTAIIFTLSSGKQIEVDLHETANGNLLLRAHNGKVSVASGTESCEIGVVD